MRFLLHIGIHAAVFALVYRLAWAHGLHGEIPYVAAAVATGLLAHLMYHRRFRRRRGRGRRL